MKPGDRVIVLTMNSNLKERGVLLRVGQDRGFGLPMCVIRLDNGRERYVAINLVYPETKR